MAKQRSALFLMGVLVPTLLGAELVAGQEINCPRASADWLYCESRPGLRQENTPAPLVGALFYRKQPAPKQVSREGVRVTTDIGTFRYGEREDPLSSGGWLLVDERTIQEASSTEPAITLEEAGHGFYNAPFHGRKNGTPPNWVFVEVDGTDGTVYWTKTHLMYWVSPTKLDGLSLGQEG